MAAYNKQISRNVAEAVVLTVAGASIAAGWAADSYIVGISTGVSAPPVVGGRCSSGLLFPDVIVFAQRLDEQVPADAS